MNLAFRKRSAVERGLKVLALVLCPASLYAQICPMCYQAAANSSSQLIDALKHGILLMLFPPLFITGGIAFLAYQRRNQFNKASSHASNDRIAHVELDLGDSPDLAGRSGRPVAIGDHW